MLGPALVFSTGTRNKHVRKLHDQYGDVFRIGAPPTYRLRRPNTVSDHLSPPSLSHSVVPINTPGPNELSIRDISAVQAIAGPSGLPKGTGEHHDACSLLRIVL